MTELQITRYDALARRTGDLKGPGSKISEILTELFPVFDVENVPAELLLLMGTFLCVGRTAKNGVAAVFQASMLRNPVGSGKIMRLLEVRFSSTTAQEVFAGPTENNYSNLGTRAILDLRAFAPTTPVGEPRDDEILVAAPDFMRIQVNATDDVVLHPPIAQAVLSPNGAFGISTSTLATSLRATYMWLERTAEPSELNL